MTFRALFSRPADFDPYRYNIYMAAYSRWWGAPVDVTGFLSHPTVSNSTIYFPGSIVP